MKTYKARYLELLDQFNYQGIWRGRYHHLMQSHNKLYEIAIALEENDLLAARMFLEEWKELYSWRSKVSEKPADR